MKIPVFPLHPFTLAILAIVFSGECCRGETDATTNPSSATEPQPQPQPAGKVAFTFDCAQWNDSGLDQILEVLKKRRVQATFFVTGRFIEVNPAALEKIVLAGFEVANHSYEHDKKNSVAECDRVARLYKEAFGKEMARFFRAPYLYEKHINWDHYSKNGWGEGYVSLITCDCLPEFKYITDQEFMKNFTHYVNHGANQRINIKQAADCNGAGHINGASILMHIDGYRCQILEQMIDVVQKAGYLCTTHSEAARALATPLSPPISKPSQEITAAAGETSPRH